MRPLEYYSASSGKFLQTFRDNLSVLTPEDLTDIFYQNIYKNSQLLAA